MYNPDVLCLAFVSFYACIYAVGAVNLEEVLLELERELRNDDNHLPRGPPRPLVSKKSTGISEHPAPPRPPSPMPPSFPPLPPSFPTVSTTLAQPRTVPTISPTLQAANTTITTGFFNRTDSTDSNTRAETTNPKTIPTDWNTHAETTTIPTTQVDVTGPIIPGRNFAPIPGFLEFQAASAATLGIESTLGLYYGEFPDLKISPLESWIDDRNSYMKDIKKEVKKFSELYKTANEPMKSNIAILALQVMTSTIVHRRMQCRDAIFTRVLYQTVARKARATTAGTDFLRSLESIFEKVFPSNWKDMLKEYALYYKTGVAVILQEYFFRLWVSDYNEILWRSIYSIEYSFQEPGTADATAYVIEATIQAHRDKMDCKRYDVWEKEWLSESSSSVGRYKQELYNLYSMLNSWLSRRSGIATDYDDLKTIMIQTMTDMTNHTFYLQQLVKKIAGTNEELLKFIKETLDYKEIKFVKKLLRSGKTDNSKSDYPETIAEVISAQRKELQTLDRLKKELEKLKLTKSRVYSMLDQLIKTKRNRFLLYIENSHTKEKPKI